jgi:hypothetical protein
MQPRRLRATVRNRDADQDVLRPGLGIFGHHVEVEVRVEDTRIGQFELGLLPAPALVLFDEQGVRKLSLGILVERFQIGMHRRGVEVEVALLHILSVVSLWAGEAE